ncbi:MAG TPA: hypothetical protein VKK31_14360 [Thermoanaerobaculia bacterium]|nr:hypothetical protein [Thermoanaerobaculia bacterium]
MRKFLVMAGLLAVVVLVDNCNAGRTVCLSRCGTRPSTSFSC